MWRRNISLPGVSRSCDCHVFGQAFLSWQITENDWIDLLTANNPLGKRRHCIFHSQYYLQIFSRQMAILRYVITVDVFSNQEKYTFNISTFLLQPSILFVRARSQFLRAAIIIKYLLRNAVYHITCDNCTTGGLRLNSENSSVKKHHLHIPKRSPQRHGNQANSRTFCSNGYFSISRDFLYDDTLPLDHFIRFLFIFVPFHSYTFYLLSACKHFSPVLL